MEDLTRARIINQMHEAEAKIQEIRQKLVCMHATGEAGAGAVKATVNGRKEVLKLDIDTAFMHPEEKEVLQDLIIAAISLACEAVDEKIQDEVKQSSLISLKDFPIDLIDR